MRRFAVAAFLGLAAMALYACDNLSVQRADKTWRPADAAPDNKIWPPSPPPHTVPRLAENTTPPPLTLALLQRGEQRFNIYCAPCHSRLGDGQGMVVHRGFPAPPSYHAARLRQAPFQHFYDVITNGYGVMYSYASRVAPEDRWAIAAYIRALQLSQDLPVTALTAEQQAELPR
jgi:mono/diheme cytochrome c family protein